MGSHDYDASHHPRPEQRGRAFATGMNAGFQVADLRVCKAANEAAACKRASEATKRNAEIADLTDTNLWEWSNRLAKKIAQFGQP